MPDAASDIAADLTARPWFFCGIGGSGMLPLAMILKGLGAEVAGSDRSRDQGRSSEKFAALERDGFVLFPQDGSGINSSAQVLIASAAVEDTVPEMVRAKELGCARMSRAELLSALFNTSPCGIAIGGTSGKSGRYVGKSGCSHRRVLNAKFNATAKGVGLAAPQVAVSQRLIVVRLPDDEESKKEYGKQAGVLYVVANPEIVKASDEMVEGVEACLSIPGYFGSVDRHQKVTIKGQDRKGKEIRIKASDWLARVFQHEIDHLDGRLYIDIANEVWEAKPESDAEAAPEQSEKAE